MPQPVVHFEVIGKDPARPASTSANSSVGSSTFRLPCRREYRNRRVMAF